MINACVSNEFHIQLYIKRKSYNEMFAENVYNQIILKLMSIIHIKKIITCIKILENNQ